MEPAIVDKQTQDQKKKQAALYKAIWRWHFYAGIIFAPFLIILAITGSVYLFKPQIEQMLYQDFYEVKQQKERIAPSEQLDIVTNHYAGAEVTSYRPGEQATRSSEVNITYQ
ncbi:PepSY domain-containing protein, partial [Niallia taxi]|uniref:PepSY domain-containing protein n=1 Tax=Niallia taxi TaxID=2499688 RepID=UPI00300A2208